jgi:protoporphyrinogen oxidase
MRFNKTSLFRLLSVIVLASGAAGRRCKDPDIADIIDKDVVIIGAGMAGLYASKTLMEEDPNLDFVILESNTRVGGRVHSTHFGTRPGGGTYTLEEGANWLADEPFNSALDLAREYGLDMTPQAG